MTNNGGGNPNHDAEGKFTSGSNKAAPKAQPSPLEKLMGGLMKGANKDLQEENRRIEAIKRMGFDSGEEKDNEMINKAIDDLKKYSGNDKVNKDWESDVYYQLRDNGADEETALRLSKKFADSVPTHDEVYKDESKVDLLSRVKEAHSKQGIGYDERDVLSDPVLSDDGKVIEYTYAQYGSNPHRRRVDLETGKDYSVEGYDWLQKKHPNLLKGDEKLGEAKFTKKIKDMGFKGE